MLPAASRLRDGRDIVAVSRAGARARRGDLAVAARCAPDPRPPRAAVVVGKRAGGAVDRNRLRRRVRHVLAGELAALPAGTDLVVRAGVAAQGLSHAALTAELRTAVDRAVDRAASGRAR